MKKSISLVDHGHICLVDMCTPGTQAFNIAGIESKTLKGTFCEPF